ncbi:hypothetical protein L1S35_05320 [Flavobacterium sp. AS60]|uniref:hypothetical protein n=1 Tax=Flavobacterium anseongense TaxID=2910677 RepID=UPI001F318180|nr:hypothetical protein [Flavobacterium sp. AS60]MCF6129085.1 hypothetical protein [Flavobacterium sp. AS60]
MKIKIIILLLFFANSCTQNSKQKDQFKSSDVPKEYQDLLIKVETIRIGMINYMKEVNPDYTEKDVNQCVTILHNYILELAKSNSKADGMEIVKSKIQELNELNKNCGEQLIETGEREQIAEVIILAGNKKGYNSKDEDITEAWREW